MTTKNFGSLLILIVFFSAIITPLAGALFQEDQQLSSTEKRKLNQLPELPEEPDQLSTFITEFENYYNDQFGFRSIFLSGYSKVKRLLGDEDITPVAKNVGTKNIISGKNGWFFLNRKWDGDPVSDYRNLDLYNEEQLMKATLLFAARAYWLKQRGIEYLFFFAPNKHTIYSEFLPDYIQKEGDISAWDQLNDALQRHTSVNYVDLRKPLISAKDKAVKYWQDSKEQAALYYKKDSHWNGAGADIAQFIVAGRLAEMFPGKITPFRRSPEDFFMDRFAGDISLIMGSKEKEAYGPKLKKGRCTDLVEKDYLQRSHVTNCPGAQLNALFFYDSFLPPLKPYFTDYFQRAVYYWRRMNLKDVKKQIKIVRPDIVIEERAERHLPFIPDVGNEDYSEFWHHHWDKWREEVYSFSPGDFAAGETRSENVRFKHLRTKKALEVQATTTNPVMYMPDIDVADDGLYLAKIEVHSQHPTTFQLYYEIKGKKGSYPTEPFSMSRKIKKGINHVYLPLLDHDLTGRWRIDPGRYAGKYVIRQVTVKKLDWQQLK